MNRAVVPHAELPKKLNPVEAIVVSKVENASSMMQFVHLAVKKPKFLFNPVVINQFIAATAFNPEDPIKSIQATLWGGFFYLLLLKSKQVIAIPFSCAF
jgi:hypothetical protein